VSKLLELALSKIAAQVLLPSRAVDEKEAQALAESCNAAWTETSAKEDRNVGK
jgi:Ras family